MSTEYQKTVAEMDVFELIKLRDRIYNQKRKNDNKRLDLQLHAVQGELKDRGHVTKHAQRLNEFSDFTDEEDDEDKY